MSGLNSLSGINQVNVDFRPTTSLDARQKTDAKEPQQAQNVAPGNAQPPQADTKSVVRQLDVLLLGAAKKSVATDIGKNLATVGQTLVAKGVMTQADLLKLSMLAKDAADKMKALDKFSGRELAAAMMIANTNIVDGGEDGVIDLDDDDEGKAPAQDAGKGDKFIDTQVDSVADWNGAAGKAVQDAIEAQQELAYELSLFNEALAQSDSVDAALQEQFTELQFQCGRRASEIDSVVFRMCDLVQQNAGKKDDEIDAKTKAFLDAKFMELMSREAVLMHGTAEAFESINRTMGAKLRPLAQKLDAFAADGSKILTKAEVKALDRAMADMKNAIANVRKNGIDIRQDAKFGTVRTEVDKSLLDEMDRILSQVAAQLRQAKLVSTARTVDAFIKEVGKSLTPKNPPGAGEIRTDDQFMVAYTVEKNGFLRTLDDFANGRITAEQFETNIDNSISAFGSGDFKLVETNLYKCGVSEPVALDIGKTVRRLKIVKAQFKELMRSVAELKGSRSDFRFANNDVLRIMLGEAGLSNAIESKVRGFKPGDVDSATEESNIVGSKPLGAGNCGKTYLLTTKTGGELVFKPELDSRLGLDSMVYSMGGSYKDKQNAANLNLATQDTAKAFGCEDLVVKYSVGSHEGQFGFFMGKAKGYTGHDFVVKNKIKGGEGVPPAELDSIQGAAERLKVQGELAKKLNRLLWLDLITAQGDRHNSNYYVSIDKTTHEVTVNAIDNDASFTTRHIGLQKYALDKKLSDRFLAELKAECEALYGTKNGNTEFNARVSTDPAIVRGEGGTLTVDLTKAKSPEVKMALVNIMGVHGIAIPEEIDRDFYDKLMQMRGNTAARKNFLASLRPRLSPEALRATEMRLDDAIKHAEQLHREGKVYGDAQWRDGETLSKMSVRKTEEEVELSDHRHVEIDDDNGQFVSDYFRTSCPSYFTRDYYHLMF